VRVYVCLCVYVNVKNLNSVTYWPVVHAYVRVIVRVFVNTTDWRLTGSQLQLFILMIHTVCTHSVAHFVCMQEIICLFTYSCVHVCVCACVPYV